MPSVTQHTYLNCFKHGLSIYVAGVDQELWISYVASLGARTAGLCCHT